VALRSGKTPPRIGSHEVHGDALAFGVLDTKIELRPGISARSKCPKLTQRRRVVAALVSPKPGSETLSRLFLSLRLAVWIVKLFGTGISVGLFLRRASYR
jgi:hypothetical protein